MYLSWKFYNLASEWSQNLLNLYSAAWMIGKLLEVVVFLLAYFIQTSWSCLSLELFWCWDWYLYGFSNLVCRIDRAYWLLLLRFSHDWFIIYHLLELLLLIANDITTAVGIRLSWVDLLRSARWSMKILS